MTRPTLKDNIKYLFLAYSILFTGYYVLLIIWLNLGISESRMLTIPLRLTAILLLYLIYKSNEKLKFKPSIRLFILFSTFYYIRIVYESIFGDHNLYTSTSEIFFYYTALIFIPFILIMRTKLRPNNYNSILNAVLYSTFFLSLLTFIFYNSIIGTVGRISNAFTQGEMYLSPISLSYSGALGIGLGSVFLITNRYNVGKLKTTFVIGLILLSLIPFFLGSSRGSIFAIAIPFALLFNKIKSIKKKINVAILVVIITAAIIILSDFFGSSILLRLLRTQQEINDASNLGGRSDLWISSINQFLENTIFGNSLQNEMFHHYPHNFFLEALISTGIIGFIPLFILVYNGVRKSLLIVKLNPTYSWLSVLFLQCLVQYSFSGSLYSAGWLFTSLGLVLIFPLYAANSQKE